MAYVVYEPNHPQEHAQLAHGSGSKSSGPRPRSQAASTTVEQVTTSQQGSQEMLENVTLIALFGKEDTAAELQSHAARTQDTLVNAVENAEVTEIKRAVFRALTRLRVTELIRLLDLKRRSPTRTTRPSGTKPCLTSSGHPVFFHASEHRDRLSSQQHWFLFLSLSKARRRSRQCQHHKNRLRA